MTDNDVDRDLASPGTFDAWASFMLSICTGMMDLRLDRDKRGAFTGWAQPFDLFGLPAVGYGADGVRSERTARHVRLGPDDYAVNLQLAGDGVAAQGDSVAKVASGDLLLIDLTRPAWRLDDDGRMFGFRLPRKFFASCLGYEPRGGLLSRGTIAGRLISQLVTETVRGEHSAPTPNGAYMQMAVYDLLTAAFAKPDGDPRSGSSHTDKLFDRVCGIIRDGVTDPDLTPSKVAAEAGISLRYLQKLFTPKGTTCIHVIHSLRLDHAVRLLHRRSIFRGRPSLSEIALASGFRDYAFFSRKFRERFGCMPSVYIGRDEVRAGQRE